MKDVRAFVLSAMALACATAVQAQDNAVLRTAAQKAIASNPEVTARLNAFRATRDEIDVARGGLLPKVDLGAEIGRTRDTIEAPSRTPPESQSLSHGQLSITATQMLWDGQATRREIGRLGHAKQARYFEFLDASEQTALEAARAYHDVQRFRRLVQLAEDNYVQHKYVQTQVTARQRAGVGRGVDSEQAIARLALAESNLVTEMANLHDVSERFRRIVGEAPPAELPAVQLDSNLAASSSAAIVAATGRSAAVAAAIENLRAVKQQAAGIKGGAYQPRVEARVRGVGGHNVDSVRDQTRDLSGTIALNWNLYNGGADQARVKQYANLINQAADLRDKACRDTRQTAAIAYNDVVKLRDQIEALRRNEASIAKARDAYRQQFDIGQRSLLDLLNAENELYTARRALSSAEADLNIAQARSLAASAALVQRLGLTKAGEAGDEEAIRNWSADGDEATRCPAEPVAAFAVDTAALDARAMKMIGAPAPAPAPAAAPAAAAPAPAPAAVVPAEPAEFATRRLNEWVDAWNAKNVSRYLSFYGKDFKPAKPGGLTRWLAERRRLVGKPGSIDVTLFDVSARTLSPTTAETSFTQNYRSSNFNDSMRKTLTWQRIGSDWFIVRESNR